jgi:hypothetical protein
LLLPLHREAAQPELERESFFVHGLQQSGPSQGAMDLEDDRDADLVPAGDGPPTGEAAHVDVPRAFAR